MAVAIDLFADNFKYGTIKSKTSRMIICITKQKWY